MEVPPLLTRRSLQVGAAAVVSLLFESRASIGAENDVFIQIRTDSATFDKTIPVAARENLSIRGDDSEAGKALQEAVPSGRAIPIILIVTGLIVIPLLVQMIQELLRQNRYGGVILDLRQTPPMVTPDLAIPANMVFVIGVDGKVQKYNGIVVSADFLRAALKK